MKRELTKKEEIIRLIASSGYAFDKEGIAKLVDTTPEYVYDVALEAGLHRRLKGVGPRGPRGGLEYPGLPTKEEQIAEMAENSVRTILGRMADALEDLDDLTPEDSPEIIRAVIREAHVEASKTRGFISVNRKNLSDLQIGALSEQEEVLQAEANSAEAGFAEELA